MDSTQAEAAIKQIDSARDYTLRLIADVEEEEWFRDAGMGTHLAWQIGHLAMAEYGLCLFRQRGRLDIDRQLMPGDVRKKYSRGSTPDFDPAGQPSPHDLLALLDRIHQQVHSEVPRYSDEELAAPVDFPYAAYPTRLGALLFCAHHEMLHAGQIGLIRRALGKEPLR